MESFLKILSRFWGWSRGDVLLALAVGFWLWCVIRLPRKLRLVSLCVSIMRLNHELFRGDVPVELSRKLGGTCVIMSSLRASARDANGSCAYRFRIQFESFPHPFKMHMLCVRWMPRQIDCLDLLQIKIIQYIALHKIDRDKSMTIIQYQHNHIRALFVRLKIFLFVSKTIFNPKCFL